MRVHEFAKQLTAELGKEVKSSQIIDILSGKKEGLKAQSSIDDAMMKFVRESLGGNKPVEAKKEEPKKAGPKKEEGKKEAPKQENKKVQPKPNNNSNSGNQNNQNKKNNNNNNNQNRNNNQGKNNNNNGNNQGRNNNNKQNNNGNNQGKNYNNKPANGNIQNGAKQESRGTNFRNAVSNNRNTRNNNNNNNRFNNNNNRNNNNNKNHQPAPKKQEPVEPVIKTIKLPEVLTVGELASKIKVPVAQLIKKMFMAGKMYNVNSDLPFDEAADIALEYNFIAEEEEKVDVIEELLREEEEDEADMTSRPPVVCVMGHVDHGKTSLLDYIRKANVIAGEAGGITQHIGAYHVSLEDGRKITFLDTPGHEAFTAMRARGAKVTDIAIIIVAADDNVMPQTKEAINHAMAAGVPIVFAINKVDKPTANPDKIKEELAAMNFLVEEWGGKYQSQDISAKKGIGVNDLMEKVLLEAEMLELKANPNRNATGSIIESTLDKGRGYVATVLVSNGTLKVGDIVLAGTSYGRVKAMFNERNQRIKQAGPSEPALILGLNGAPAAGDTFHVVETDQEAREITNKREQLQREQGLRTQKILTLDELGRRIALGNFQELNVIVKGDVDGSVEALSDSLIKLSTEQIQVNVIHKGVGQISESDVSLAAASDAIIIGFQVRPSGAADRMAEKEGVDIRKYSVIYDAIEEVKAAMEGMLAPEVKEVVTATIEVREVFNITKVGTVAGAMVKTGKVKRSDKARLIRDGIVIFSGAINALKRFKDDVKEVGTNFECGISLVGTNDLKVGDMIETYEEVEVKQTL